MNFWADPFTVSSFVEGWTVFYMVPGNVALFQQLSDRLDFTGIRNSVLG